MSIKDRKQKRQKAKEPYISPENKMDPKTMEEFMKNYKENKEEIEPIFEMDENRIMPLFMFIGDVKMSFFPLGTTEMNFMITISHLKKENHLEIRGRTRFEGTGRKTVFNLKRQFQLTELDKAKEEVRKLYKEMCEEMHLSELHTPHELNFEINESADSIIKKLNASNLFDIGVGSTE